MPARQRKPDPEDLLRELARFAPYSRGDGAMDAYHDFRLIFLGSDQGKRVLSQILAWAHVMRSTADPDPIQMALLNGERNLGLKILGTVEIEPPAQRKTARRA